MGDRTILHVEIPSSDQKETRAFYADLFGWDFQTDEQMNYTTFDTGNLKGGLADVNDAIKPGGTVLYIDSRDVTADLEKIESLGGKTVIPKTEIPTIGWFAIFTDPSGNLMGLLQSLPS